MEILFDNRQHMTDISADWIRQKQMKFDGLLKAQCYLGLRGKQTGSLDTIRGNKNCGILIQ